VDGQALLLPEILEGVAGGAPVETVIVLEVVLPVKVAT